MKHQVSGIRLLASAAMVGAIALLAGCGSPPPPPPITTKTTNTQSTP